MNSTIAQAVKEHRILAFSYHGYPRVVEPHTYGIYGATGNEVIVTYQTRGGSQSGGIPDWRTFNVSEILGLNITEEKFERTRPGYNPNDSRIRSVFARA